MATIRLPSCVTRLPWRSIVSAGVVALAWHGAVAPAVVRGETYTLFLNYDGDANFPEFSDDPSLYLTSPLASFAASQLGVGFDENATGSIRGLSTSIVRDLFSEFDLSVTDRRPTSGRYQTVGIDHQLGWPLAGLADGADSLADDQDYARVWGGSFGEFAAFSGVGATVERWSRAIGYTAIHEAAHNYGASHLHAEPTTAEQGLGYSVSDHVLATGAQLTPEQRATVDRSFSDTTYRALAASLGLRAKTLWNWQITNSNDVSADRFHVVFESAHDDLTFAWEYSGDPFFAPTLFQLGEQAEGIYRYELVWSGGSGVGAGEAFRTGISFGEASDFAIIDTYLAGEPGRLSQQPALVSPRLDFTDPDLPVLVLANDTAEEVTVRNLRFRELPRMVDLERMSPEFGETLWTRPIGGILDPQDAYRRQVVPTAEQWYEDAWELGPGEFDLFDLLQEFATDGSGGEGDREGASASMRDLLDGSYDLVAFPAEDANFEMSPATYIYVTAELVAPDQLVWDPTLQQHVVRDVVTEIAFQLAGVSMNPAFQSADLNFDGNVDALDAALLFEAWSSSEPVADIVADGIIDAADAALLFAQWTGDGSPLQVPEPQGSWPIGFGWGIAWGIRRCRNRSRDAMPRCQFVAE